MGEASTGRYLAMRLLDGGEAFWKRAQAQLGVPEEALRQARKERAALLAAGYDEDTWSDAVVAAIYRRADEIAAQTAPATRTRAAWKGSAPWTGWSPAAAWASR